jgi:hypothetical protein
MKALQAQLLVGAGLHAKQCPAGADSRASPLPPKPAPEADTRHPNKEAPTMCGIVTAIATQNVVRVLLEGLRKLE